MKIFAKVVQNVQESALSAQFQEQLSSRTILISLNVLSVKRALQAARSEQ